MAVKDCLYNNELSFPFYNSAAVLKPVNVNWGWWVENLKRARYTTHNNGENFKFVKNMSKQTYSMMLREVMISSENINYYGNAFNMYSSSFIRGNLFL